MNDFILCSILGVLLGGAVLGFYSLLKLRRGSLDKPIYYFEADTAVNYMSATEFVSQPERRWATYLTFRTLPILAAQVLLYAVLQKQENIGVGTFISATVCLFLVAAFPNVLEIFNGKRFLTIRIFAFCMTAWLSLASAATLILGLLVDLRWVAPSLSSVRDNLWSAIIAAIIVVIYFRVTDLSRPARTSPQTGAQSEFVDQFVRARAQKINGRLGQTIDEASRKFSVDPILILAILVHEDLNRPAPIRFIENIIVSLTPLSLTVGIAQVKSSKRLTDSQSVFEMCRYINSTLQGFIRQNYHWELGDIIREYNDSDEYVCHVLNVYQAIQKDGYVS